MNKYLVKIAALGEVYKSLIREKIGPRLQTASKAGVAKLESLSRAAAGSPVHSGIFSKGELAQHMQRMKTVGSQLLPSTGGMLPREANKITAVAARAARMGILKKAGVLDSAKTFASDLSGTKGPALRGVADDLRQGLINRRNDAAAYLREARSRLPQDIRRARLHANKIDRSVTSSGIRHILYEGRKADLRTTAARQTVKKGLTTAGKIGAVGAAGVGVGLLAKKMYDSAVESKTS